MEKPSKYPSNSIRMQKRANFSFNFVSTEDVLAGIERWISRKPFRRMTFRLKFRFFAGASCLKLSKISDYHTGIQKQRTYIQKL